MWTCSSRGATKVIEGFLFLLPFISIWDFRIFAFCSSLSLWTFYLFVVSFCFFLSLSLFLYSAFTITGVSLISGRKVAIRWKIRHVFHGLHIGLE